MPTDVLHIFHMINIWRTSVGTVFDGAQATRPCTPRQMFPGLLALEIEEKVVKTQKTGIQFGNCQLKKLKSSKKGSGGRWRMGKSVLKLYME